MKFLALTALLLLPLSALAASWQDAYEDLWLKVSRTEDTEKFEITSVEATDIELNGELRENGLVELHGDYFDDSESVKEEEANVKKRPYKLTIVDYTWDNGEIKRTQKVEYRNGGAWLKGGGISVGEKAPWNTELAQRAIDALGTTWRGWPTTVQSIRFSYYSDNAEAPEFRISFQRSNGLWTSDRLLLVNNETGEVLERSQF